MTTESLLHVCEQAWGIARPTAAILHVTLTGTKLFSGRAALTKSEELRKLVEALRERGVSEDAIALEGAHIDVSTGLFSRSSSVTYRASVRLLDLELLAPALDAIASAKQATLSHVEWDFRGARVDELLADCATRAVAKAKRLAASLGVTLGGVHEVREEEMGDAHGMPHVRCAAMAGGMISAMKGRASVSSELEGLDLAPTKSVGVRVLIAYRVRAA